MVMCNDMGGNTCAQGIVRTGDQGESLGIPTPLKTTVTGVEMFKKQLNEGQAGDNVGLLLRGIKRDDVVRGQVRCPITALQSLMWAGVS